jgi:hypothetical protein
MLVGKKAMFGSGRFGRLHLHFIDGKCAYLSCNFDHLQRNKGEAIFTFSVSGPFRQRLAKRGGGNSRAGQYYSLRRATMGSTAAARRAGAQAATSARRQKSTGTSA